MVAFDVNTIVSQINRNYPSKPHLYEVRIFGSPNTSAPAEIMMNCSEVSIPGINIEIMTEKRYGVGQTYNVTEMKTFSEVSMTFYESETEQERKYFSDWINTIIDPNSKKVNFYKDYVRDIQILQYNNKKQLTYRITLQDCIPGNISALERGYDKSETIPTFTINIKFQDIFEEFSTRT